MSKIITCISYTGAGHGPFGSPFSSDPSAHSVQPQPGVPGQREADVKVELEQRDLWQKFYSVGTEMIITKMGR